MADALRWLKSIWTGFILAWSASAMANVAIAPLGYVEGADSPEDLVYLPATDWVIASSPSHGGLLLVNTVTLTAEWATIANSGADTGTCSRLGDPERFVSHGLGLRLNGKGRFTLYAVGHAAAGKGREAVEIFAIDASGVKPALTWEDCIPMPTGVWANDVVALPDGGLAITNFMDPDDPQAIGKLAEGAVTGYVLEWHSGTGLAKVPGTEMSGPNGIETDPAGASLFVNAWGSRQVFRIPRGHPSITGQSVSTGDSLPDNSAWSPDGQLLVVGQTATAREVYTCVKSPKPVCPIAFTVFAIDPLTMEKRVIISEPAPTLFGGATSPRPIGNELWLGAFRGGQIARYPLGIARLSPERR